MSTFCPSHKKGERIASSAIGYCGSCLSSHTAYMQHALENHRSIRTQEGLIASVPSEGAIVCPDCGNHCRLIEGETGFCHLRRASEGQVTEKYSGKTIVSWYFDPLPTNCVADWVCPVTNCEEIGFGKERLNNLAVFYGSCNSDCLFCQNASYREMMVRGSPLQTPRELADAANDKTACVCYFGGDPACNPEHSLKTSQLLYQERGIRVCYETNGNISRKWLHSITDIIRESGGTMKFDLKAITPQLYTALTGVSNQTVLNNFKHLAAQARDREGEFLVASILLIPGYIGVAEVRRICEFIAKCDSSIPTALLGFYPHHAMKDLPRTSLRHANSALLEAQEAGLSNVRIGNVHLLSNEKYAFD